MLNEADTRTVANLRRDGATCGVGKHKNLRDDILLAGRVAVSDPPVVAW